MDRKAGQLSEFQTTDEITTVGQLIERLQDFPSNRKVVKFEINFSDHLGYPHRIEKEYKELK